MSMYIYDIDHLSEKQTDETNGHGKPSSNPICHYSFRLIYNACWHIWLRNLDTEKVDRDQTLNHSKVDEVLGITRGNCKKRVDTLKNPRHRWERDKARRRDNDVERRGKTQKHLT